MHEKRKKEEANKLQAMRVTMAGEAMKAAKLGDIEKCDPD